MKEQIKDTFISNPFLATAKIEECPNPHIVIGDKPFELATRQIIAKIPDQNMSNLNGDLDLEAMAKSAIYAEFVRDVQADLYSKYLEIGRRNQESKLSKFKLFLSKKLGIQPKTFIGDLSVEQAAFDIATDILLARNFDLSTKFNDDSFCVLSAPFASILGHSQYFKANEKTADVNDGRFYLAGSIFQVQVFVDSDNVDPHSDGILLTGKIASEVTLGYKELDFIESSAFAEMNGYKNLAINGRLVIAEDTNNCQGYGVITISPKKKPLFRKLFNL